MADVWYVYPMFKNVSFNVIAEEHVKLLNKHLTVQTVDEKAFPMIGIPSNPTVIIQPYFHLMQAYKERASRVLKRVKAVIGVDVADSDHISEHAVKLTEDAAAMIVPSNFARQAYVSSGVRKPVHVIPHGVHEEYIDAPKRAPSAFKALAELKERRRMKLILSWITHSPHRKGLDILLKYYRTLSREYADVTLVLKTASCVGTIPNDVEYRGGPIEDHMKWRTPAKWLSEAEKMELFDVCDLFMLSSRGGGFEHPALEAMARGEIALAARGGAWQDYLPEWALIPSARSGRVLPDNTIHDGFGVEMLTDKAVDKTIEIFDDIDEYRAKVKKHVNTHIRENFTWERIGLKLVDVVEKYV